KYAIVCNACDEKHQMLPKLGDMVPPSPATAAKLRDAHTMHVMLWIRDDAVEDQLSRVEDNLSAVKLLVRQHQGREGGDVANLMQRVENHLGQVDHLVEAVNRLSTLEARFESMEDALGTLRDFILNSMTRGY
ncbi:hypothetical protein C0991_001704, partial [Blastosporella zonata]